jgi:hypothetical protein
MKGGHSMMSFSRTRFSAALITLISLFIAVFSVTARALAQDSYTTREARPMYEVAKALEQKYGWRITYEDPPLEHASELKDITNPAYKAMHPDPNDVTLVPLAVPFTFTWKATGRDYIRQDVLEQCVDQHNRMAQNPGRFYSYQQGSVSHIIASEFRRKDGSMARAQSPLDTIVSFPAEERTLLQTVLLILSSIESQSGTHISLGMAPGHVMMQKISVGAHNITARDALLVALNALDARDLEMGAPLLRMSWAMLYQADEQGYYFNLDTTHSLPASDMVLGKAN